MIYPGINTEVIKDFLRAVYKTKKRELKRKKHRDIVSGHISRIKKITLSKNFDKKTIEQEFEKLELSINTALEREKQILEEQKHGSDLFIQLRNRLDRLESQLQKEKGKQESLDQIKSALQRIHGEVRSRKKKRIKQKIREKELEEKIKKS